MHLRARSNPIIEHSDTLQFASYSPEYPGCDEQLAAAGLSKDNGLWKAVQDFGWLKQSQSPNWYGPTTRNVLYISLEIDSAKLSILCFITIYTAHAQATPTMHLEHYASSEALDSKLQAVSVRHGYDQPLMPHL